jgi:hypothetical protein
MAERLTQRVFAPASPTRSYIGWFGATVGIGATLEVEVTEDEVGTREVGTSRGVVLKASTICAGSIMFAVLMLFLL